MASDYFTVNSNMKQLEHFLERRGVSEGIINYIISENIDADAIVKMVDKDLIELFPKYGDRIAVVDFCKRQTVSPSKKKQGLLTKLRKKLRRRDKSSTGDESTTDDEVPKPRKNVRKIELGWLHYDKKKEKYIQVRTKFGGGTRTVIVPKESKKDFLLSKAVDMFFSNGVSPKGNIENMKYDLMDFKETVLNDNISIEEIYKFTGLCKIKFYLATMNKKYQLLELSDHSDTDTTKEFVQASSTVVRDIEDLVQSATSTTVNVNNFTPVAQEDITNAYVQSSAQPEDVLYIKVHRGQVLTELIDIFMNTHFEFSTVSVQMVLPDGKLENAFDSGGVFRDCLTEFWNSFYDQYTVGTKMKIPYVRHDFTTDKWKAVAKIIKKGWICEKYFPVKLLSPFMESCLLDCSFTDLSSSLMEYITENDAKTLKNALEDFSSVDKDDLLDTLSNLEAKWNPTKENIKQLIEDIAHRDIIQKPKFVIDCWQEILLGFMDIIDLRNIYKSAQPNSKNVVELLSFPSELNEEKIKTISFLKKYIREANINYLAHFLRFCTGADIITDNKILINFIKMEGFHRCPIARTCGCMLELPYSYDNFPEFRSELNSVLSSNIWVMDII